MQHLLEAFREHAITAVQVSERHQLILVNSGNYQLQTQQSHPLIAGSIALLPAGQLMSVANRLEGDVRSLCFCGNCLALEQGHSLLAPFRLARFSEHKVVQCNTEQQRWLNQLLDQIETHQDRHFSAQYDVLKSLLLLVLHEISILYPIEKARPRSQKVDSALQYIEMKYREPISLEDVANHVHWSAPYLANKMKSETGRSVGEWLQTFRLAEAASRLIHFNEGIAETALSVGYQDVTHFIRQFKRQHHKTPAAWRKTHQQKSGLTFEYQLTPKLR
ncbi:helix-turn-helix domain-containing protein [Reinekea sp. G2M2-21]|uniref:helix-turn-helix domain-containing protein n=1 Tax=Reinekea sp. G2M2-21 TaxID=2788942 RepID=UPI0018A88D17|nr:AraC family transcriptional regulator [Reinekea sp. G2M2-21]